MGAYAMCCRLLLKVLFLCIVFMMHQASVTIAIPPVSCVLWYFVSPKDLPGPPP